MQHFAGQQVLVGRHVLGGLALDAVKSRSLDPAKQGRGDGRGHLVLDLEDVLQSTVIALRPDVGLGLAVDELDSDSHAIGGFADTAFHDVVDAEFAGDLLRLDGLALVDEDGVARNHEELAEAGKLSDDVLGEAVSEELLLWIAAHVDEGQYSDCGASRRGLTRRCIVAGVRVASAFSIQHNLEDADPAADVLDLLFAEVYVIHLKSVADLVPHRGRDTYAARFGKGFEPRSDIDPVSENVASLDDHVSQIDADPVKQRPGCRHIPIPAGHAQLEVDRAAERLGDALELDKHAVAGGLDDFGLCTSRSRDRSAPALPS